MENSRENRDFLLFNMASPDRRVLGDIQNKFASDALSPTTNLKLLTEVASDLENRWNKSSSPKREPYENCKKKCTAKRNAERKLKSLTLLCEKFLQIFPLNVPPNENIIISLDNVAERLETERRRLYDIINMLESLQMARKVAKNSYRWFGCQKLHVTLAHLKVLAIKLGLERQVNSIQARNNFETFDFISENSEQRSHSKTDVMDKNIGRVDHQTTDGPIVQFIITDEDGDGDDSITTLNVDIVKKKFEPVPSSMTETFRADVADLMDSEFSKMLPKIKSLGMLCQSFLMIFLVANKSYPITLDDISRLLGLPGTVEGDNDMVSCVADACPKDSAISHKTKLRRLYDIANVLSSLHIICKIKRYELLTKKPLFKYTGPPVEVGDVLQSAKLDFSNLTRHSLLGNENMDTEESKTVLELEVLSGNQPQWIISTLTVDSRTQHKRKLENRTSETTPKLLRTKSNDILCRKKKNECRNENNRSCLDGIFNIAEMELRRLQSMERESSLLKSPEEKKKHDNRDEQPSAARRRLFSRHHSEPCINFSQNVNGKTGQEPQKHASLCNHNTDNAAAYRNQTSNASSVKNQMNNASSVRNQVGNVSSIRTQTGNASSIRTQTGNASSIRTQIGNVSSVRNQINNASSIRNQTGNASPIRNQTSNTFSIRNQTDNASSVKNETCTALSVRNKIVHDLQQYHHQQQQLVNKQEQQQHQQEQQQQQQQDGMNASTTDKLNSVVMMKCSEVGTKHFEQKVKESEKQCAVIPTQTGQKLKIVRRLQKLTYMPMSARSLFLKTFTCRPVKIVSLCSSNPSLTKSAETTVSSASRESIHQEEVKDSGSAVVANFHHMTTLKDLDYSKLPKLKLVKVGKVTKLIPLCNGNSEHK